MTIQNQLQSPPTGFVPENSELAKVRAEYETLLTHVRQLEDQRASDQKRLAELEQDRRTLYQIVQGMFKDEDLYITEEELRDLLAGKDTLPLEAFIGELEQIAKGS